MLGSAAGLWASLWVFATNAGGRTSPGARSGQGQRRGSADAPQKEARGLAERASNRSSGALPLSLRTQRICGSA
eukprot:4203935-Alexandrium_andersonii.AAC.1